MNDQYQQRVVRRNALLSRLLTAVVVLSVLLLLYSVVRGNLPADSLAHWPWRLQLLDTQSAATAAVASAGAALARAQYARAVRPALGHTGRVKAGLAPGGRLAWVSELLNGGQDTAVVRQIRYLAALTPGADPSLPVHPPRWRTVEEARAELEAQGLAHGEDFFLPAIGPGWPMAGQSRLLLGWFTERAMTVVEEMSVNVRVVDRVGDLHERIVRCMYAADRAPRTPTPERPDA
ncbi:hypothetical protein AB0K43_14915 [Kitasatospora sp. NPDC049258]|uniref:hypothetical protein n=1 Tax=Kitasatospora sp. NPDC049258 TaxID=3155394 RepID=UPI0034318E74